jgi:hypothetical protein
MHLNGGFCTKKNCQRHLAAGLKVIDGNAQRSIECCLVKKLAYQNRVERAYDPSYENEAEQGEPGDGLEREAGRVQHDAHVEHEGGDVGQRGEGAHQARVVPQLQVLKRRLQISLKFNRSLMAILSQVHTKRERERETEREREREREREIEKEREREKDREREIERERERECHRVICKEDVCY